jgi:hypothetical protein
MSGLDRAGAAVERHVDNRTTRLAGRVGLSSYGVVHLLVAFLALRIAFGDSEQASKSGALRTLAQEPAGQALLWVIAFGLAALVVWELLEAAVGHEHLSGKERTGERIASVVKAVVYGALSASAVRVALGSSSDSEQQQEAATATVLGAPGGQVLVGLGGLVVLGIAGYLVYKGVAKRFKKHLDLGGADRRARRTTVALGQVGWTALGVVYGVVGLLFLTAAFDHDPEKAGGLDAGLKTLAGQPFGQVLLVVVALGLAAFGVYCFFEARYRRA